MSRYHEWTSILAGITNWLLTNNYVIDVRGCKGHTDQYAGVQVSKIINRYSNEAGLKGSYSTRILMIGRNFPAFKKHCIENVPVKTHPLKSKHNDRTTIN